MKSLLRRIRGRSVERISPQLKRQQRLAELANRLPDATEQQRDLIESVSSMTMTSPERILALCHAVEHITHHQIEGDIVECGVWRGGSMVATARTLIGLNDVSRQLWLYDTFEGMSEPSGEDVDFLGQPADQLLAVQDREDQQSIWCYSPLEEVQEAMASTGYPEQDVHFVVGKVEETLPQRIPDQIALLRLDTDWYESTRCELEYLFPRMVNGGILIIDDYGHWEGCRRAVDEYIAENNINLFLQRIDYTGRIAVVTRSNSGN